MNFQKLFQDVKPHFIVIAAFFLVGYIYFVKSFNGYTNREEDVTQGMLKSTEITKYKEAEGQVPGWTNSIFSGMPSTLIYGKPSSNKVSLYNYLSPFGFTAYPFKILFLSFIGFYLLMCSFKVKPLFGALAALAYGFATYSISSIEAAHYTKVLAMALIPALIASIQWLFSGRYLLGGSMLAFNFALQIYYFHYQITFYSIICLLGFGIYYIIEAFKAKQIKTALIASLVSILAVATGVLSNTSKIKETSKFAENTMRGGNDMTKADPTNKQKETAKGGLDRDYAFKWSYGIGETFTLLIPNFYGGSLNEKINSSSKLAEATGSDHAPTYHGDLGGKGNVSTSAPIYIGSIMILLFVLGIVVVKSPIKWVLVGLTLVSFILGWGRNFELINNFLFDYLPYFNKFRTPMMAFCIAQVTIPLLGFLGIKELYEHWMTNKTSVKKGNTTNTIIQLDSKIGLWKKVQLSFYIVGGFCLLMAAIGPNIVDMNGAVDDQLKNAYFNPAQQKEWQQFHEVLNEERGALLRADAFRSFAFIGIAFGLLWAWYTNKVSKNAAIAAIGIFAVIDLVGVDWRYLNWGEFIHKKGELSAPPPDEVDRQIMADKDLHYRVFDLSGDPFNNNNGAAFHKMIGGYDPAKLSRYQDLISELLADNKYQSKALDMLNCKYLIGTDSNRRVTMQRPTANGNAWFVNQLVPAANAKIEMDSLKNINVRTTATYNQEFEGNEGLKSGSFVMDSMAQTKLLTYHPDTLRYEVNNANDGYLVFSEIYYDDWKVLVDGKESKLNKVDYTLRGLKVPAGRHEIVCYFNKVESSTDKIDFIASVIILCVLGLNIVMWLKTYFVKTE